MANPVKGEVELKTGGRSLTLIADHAALVKAAQAYTGKTKLAKLMSDIQPALDKDGKIKLDEDGEPEKDTIPATCALFYGLLDASHPELTLRDATNMLFADIERVSEKIAEALQLAWPDASPSAEGNAPSPRRGRSSGRNGVKSATTTTPSGA